MSIEQERADFEAWLQVKPCGAAHDLAWEAWQARAALQSQVKNDTTLFCDLKTDEEKSAFFLTGRGYETGVIAQAIQNDVAMAYHRCAEYKKELEALQSQDREDAEPMYYLQDTRSFVGNCPMWWAKGGNGYTNRLDEAQQYTFEQAMCQHLSRETDLPWLCSEIDRLRRPTVDVQYMHKIRIASQQAEILRQQHARRIEGDGE